MHFFRLVMCKFVSKTYLKKTRLLIARTFRSVMIVKE